MTLHAKSNINSYRHIKFLFFQKADSGHMVESSKKNCYQLILNNLNKEVLYFSDTPNKIAGYLTPRELYVTLKHDELTKKIHPNAVLNAYLRTNDKEFEISLAGTLENPLLNKNKFKYQFCTFINKEYIKRGKLREVNLFIDPIHRWPP